VTDDGSAASSIDNLEELNGKSFAIVAIEEDGEGACFYGFARWDGKSLFFDRPSMQRPVEIPQHRLSSVARTPPELRELIEADYFVTLTIGKLPDDAGDEYLRLGLKWPDDPSSS
jgi:hypothetical protein